MRTAVVGASGYLGAELLRLLAAHPTLEVVAVQADSSAGETVETLYPGLGAAYPGRRFETLDLDALAGLDVVFVALPSGLSQDVVAGLHGRVGCVVDLGADFRLRDPALYEQWYHFSHRRPDLLEKAVYGLVELNRAALAGASLVAAPGCYVTAASLALAPLVATGLVSDEPLIVDAASGTSGAGRGLSRSTHHGEVAENFRAYGLLDHRHTPEIEQAIGAPVLFTPHLLPTFRGILATCYARAASSTSTEEVLEVLAKAYAGETFVHVGEQAPSTRDVYGTNLCRLSARYNARTGHVIVLAALDNLTKGGAGQALQAANVALGLAEASGLPTVALLP